MEQAVADFIEKYGIGLYIPRVHVTDVIEVLILTFLIYQIIVWIKNTKAWMLLRGIIVLAGFILLAAIFKMHTILFIARNSLTVMATAAIVVFQPELRRALEKLGEKQFLTSVVPFEQNREIRFSEETRENIIRACFAMGKVKTGALIVVEQAIRLTEYESTGIQMDCLYPVRCWRIYLNTIPLFMTEQLLSVVTGLCRQHATFHFPTICVSVKIWEQGIVPQLE